MEVSLDARSYYCADCSTREGKLVAQLTRMIPISLIINNKLVGDEFFCCALCMAPKFHARTRKPVASYQRELDALSAAPQPSKKPNLKVVG